MKNEPKTNPIQKMQEIDLTPYNKRDYPQNSPFGPQKNKPKTNPISANAKNEPNSI